MNIKTERLVIGKFTPDMAKAVHVASLDEATKRFLPDEVFETEEIALEVLNDLIEVYTSLDGPLVYPAFFEGSFIGYVEAVPIGEGEYEIGYHVNENCRHRGFATEFVSAFLPYVMKKLDIDKIWGITCQDNKASIRVMEKCGFKLTYKGEGHYHGRLQPIVKYIFTLDSDMKINDYQKAAMRTLNPKLDKKAVLLNGVMGLCGESGECIEIVKKQMMHGNELDKEKLIKELGDVCWYIAECATALDVDMSYIFEKNVEKLKARYPEGFKTGVYTQPLETERLLLRRAEISDSDRVFNNWTSNPRVARYLTWDAHQSPADTEEYLRSVVESYQKPDTYNWLVTTRSGEPIGQINVVKVTQNGEGVLGYCYGEKYWNKGFATEALVAVCGFLFEKAGFNRLIAEHLVKNTPSGRVMEKAGFKVVGQRKIIQKGVEEDVVTRALQKEDL